MVTLEVSSSFSRFPLLSICNGQLRRFMVTLRWIRGVGPILLVGIGLAALQKLGTLGACSRAVLYFVFCWRRGWSSFKSPWTGTILFSGAKLPAVGAGVSPHQLDVNSVVSWTKQDSSSRINVQHQRRDTLCHKNRCSVTRCLPYC